MKCFCKGKFPIQLFDFLSIPETAFDAQTSFAWRTIVSLHFRPVSCHLYREARLASVSLSVGHCSCVFRFSLWHLFFLKTENMILRQKSGFFENWAFFSWNCFFCEVIAKNNKFFQSHKKLLWNSFCLDMSLWESHTAEVPKTAKFSVTAWKCKSPCSKSTSFSTFN